MPQFSQHFNNNQGYYWTVYYYCRYYTEPSLAANNISVTAKYDNLISYAGSNNIFTKNLSQTSSEDFKTQFTLLLLLHDMCSKCCMMLLA